MPSRKLVGEREVRKYGGESQMSFNVDPSVKGT